MTICRICNNKTANKDFLVREMHIGYREEFAYFECSQCGCLQIEEIPDDLSKYYPQDYYSYRASGPTVAYGKPGIGGYKIRLIVKILTRHYFHQKSFMGEWVAKKSSVSGDYPCWVRRKRLDLHLSASSVILDVGCGTGKLLLDLKEQGFSNLMGIDPFVKSDIAYESGVRVLKQPLDEVTGQYDFIMLHHSFEHMPDQLETLRKLHELIKPGHYVLLRIPVAGSYAWREYGVNWVALDAPRHLFLHTAKSIGILASQSGFEVAEIAHDSDGLAHYGFELYRNDIPLMDERSPFVNPNQKTFTKEELAGFMELDAKLNETGEADCAAFYLYKR